MIDATVREGGEVPPFGQDEIARALAALAEPDRPGGETWRMTSLGNPAAASATAGLWRIEAKNGSWSMVLKLVHHSERGHENWLSSADPGDPMYWRREPLAYESGLLDSFAGGLRAPRCLHSAERTDGSVALWLEDLGGADGWSLQRYGLAARHLGQAQGEFLLDRPLPAARWLSRGWLRAYIERRRDAVERPIPADAWRTELVRSSLPRSLEGWARDTWRSRKRTLALLDRLPSTVCHCDFWPSNLFAEALPGGGSGTVAVDWAYVGIGAIGEDVGNLVPDTLFDFFVAAERGRELLDAVREGYLEGLRDAGWRGDERLVALGLAASASVKYVWMLPWLAERALDEGAVAALAAAGGIPAAEVFARRGEVMRLLVELDREAKELADALAIW